MLTVRSIPISDPFHERSFSRLPRNLWRMMLPQVSLAPELAHLENFDNRRSSFPVHAESNSSGNCIKTEHEIAVASDAFNGTLLTSFLLFYEYFLSLSFSFDHTGRLLVDNCFGAESAQHDATIAFSDYK